MKPEVLKKKQQESRMRYKERLPENRAASLEMRHMERTLRMDFINEQTSKLYERLLTKENSTKTLWGITFFQMKKRRAAPAPKVFLPDLMAQMVADAAKSKPVDAPPPVQQPQIAETIKEAAKPLPVKQAPQKPVQEKKWAKPILRVPVLPDPPQKKFIRPAAVYTNLPSSYGIWSEMAAEQLKKSG